MTAEGGVAVAAAIAAGSVALLGFALDSVIEAAASIIVIWRLTGARTLSETAERRAHKAVAVTFFLLAPYITADAIHALATGERPGTSWPGIGLAIASLIVMPLLGTAKKKIGARLGSAAVSGEGTENILCAAAAAAVLAGLAANAGLDGGGSTRPSPWASPSWPPGKAPKPGAAGTRTGLMPARLFVGITFGIFEAACRSRGLALGRGLASTLGHAAHSAGQLPC